jgi:hypothetical protein
MVSDVPVPGHERRVPKRRLSHEDPVERVASPLLLESDSNDWRERLIADLEADRVLQRFDDHLSRLGRAPNLVEVLELKDNGWRDQEIVLIQQLSSGRREEIDPPGEQPGGDVGVEVDQGCHSPDQSRCTRSSASESR